MFCQVHAKKQKSADMNCTAEDIFSKQDTMVKQHDTMFSSMKHTVLT